MSKPPRPKQNWMQPLHIPIKIGRRKLRLLDDPRRHLLNLSDRQQAFRLAMMQDEGSSGPP